MLSHAPAIVSQDPLPVDKVLPLDAACAAAQATRPFITVDHVRAQAQLVPVVGAGTPELRILYCRYAHGSWCVDADADADLDVDEM